MMGESVIEDLIQNRWSTIGYKLYRCHQGCPAIQSCTTHNPNKKKAQIELYNQKYAAHFAKYLIRG